MLVPPDIRELHSPHLRLWRSWEHIHVLESHIARWLHSGGYNFVPRHDPDGTVHVHIRFNALPVEWSLLIGEALHSLRSSLDHLVYAMATLEQGRPLTDDESRRTEFPVYGSQPLGDRLRHQKIGLLPDEVQHAIIRYQPHTAPDFRMTKLWVLHSLDNRNKHRSIDPQLVAFESIMPCFPLRGSVEIVTPRSPLHDGLEVLTAIPADPAVDIRVVAEMSVVFPWGDSVTKGTVEGVEVVRVLSDLHEHVRSIHEYLLGLAGHLVTTPCSNAPAAARGEDDARHKQLFGPDDKDQTQPTQASADPR